MGLCKWVETRSWRAYRRGWIAIHASHGLPRDWRIWQNREPFRYLLRTLEAPDVAALPRGGIVAVGMLMSCVPTQQVRSTLTDTEVSWGDYRSGHYAFTFGPILRLERPVPCRGNQGFWGIWAELAADILEVVPDA